jgi:phosphatidyl-myo-inositol dimannoside synthase
MKLLMVTSSYPKYPGDVTSPFIESIARALAARGHAIDLVLPEHPKLRRPAHEPLRFFPYRYAPRASWAIWGYAASLEADVRVRGRVYLLAPLVAAALRRAVARRLESQRYDAVHVHWVVPNAAMIFDLVRSHRVPLVVSLHGSDVFLAERLWPARSLARRAFDAAGAITACSEDLRGRALALGAAAARTRTVAYGVDAGDFAPAPDAAALRARLGLREDERLVLGVGRLVEKKGFAQLIDASAGLEHARVVIAGAGDLRGELQARALERGAPVTLVGALERDAVRAAFAAADVVAVPSVVDRAGNVDGLPNTLLEALAAGRAVVASRLAGIPDVVQDGVNGRLVPPGDAPALAAALRELLADDVQRGRLGAAARDTAVARLGWDAAARAFEECYAEAAALDAR